MFDALYIGATGMHAQQANVDTIANNLANANTSGFKSARVSFSDMMLPRGTITTQSEFSDLSAVPSIGNNFGAGVVISNINKSFDAGEIKKTESAFDVAIQGDGFLEVLMQDGSLAYSRGGSLKINKDGQLALMSGQVLKPGISIPEGTQSITISSDGRVQVQVSGQTAMLDVGQFEMVRFASPSQLNAVGDNLYRRSEASGDPLASFAGENGTGTIMQGYVEASNVKMLEEMINLMVAQRAYEANVKIVQASDEMLGMVNNLRK